MSQFHHVCDVSDVPAGEARMFVVNEMQIAMFNIAGEFFALDNRCPHAGASLAHGFVEGNVVSCRIHHWRFCIQKGTYLDEDKPEFNAESYSVRVVGDQVHVEI